MILTVTANSALDRVLFIDEWSPGLPMRTDRYLDCMGGKGMDCSVVLRHLGVDTVALVFAGGATGRDMLVVADRYGIVTEPVWADGETRVSHVICERAHGRHNHIISGSLRVGDAHTDELLQRFRRRVGEADWVVCAGTVAPGCPSTLYRDLIAIAAESGTPVLVDCAGVPMLAALEARPAIAKMNHEEFELTFAMRPRSSEEWAEEARRVCRTHEMRALVLTLGAEGMIVAVEDGAFHVAAPVQRAVNAAGAGDAVSAALVWRLAEGDGWADALRWAAGTAAAVVLTEGTADCRAEDVERLRGEVVVRELDAG